MPLPDQISRTAHPTLALLVVVGGTLLAIGGGLALADSLLGDAAVALGFRLGFLGVLLVVFGVSGYVAIGVFDRRPET